MLARFLVRGEICEFFAAVLEEVLFAGGHILLCQKLIETLNEKLTAEIGVEIALVWAAVVQGF